MNRFQEKRFGRKTKVKTSQNCLLQAAKLFSGKSTSRTNPAPARILQVEISHFSQEFTKSAQ